MLREKIINAQVIIWDNIVCILYILICYRKVTINVTLYCLCCVFYVTNIVVVVVVAGNRISSILGAVGTECHGKRRFFCQGERANVADKRNSCWYHYHRYKSAFNIV